MMLVISVVITRLRHLQLFGHCGTAEIGAQGLSNRIGRQIKWRFQFGASWGH
jgi:hypothetical protein